MIPLRAAALHASPTVLPHKSRSGSTMHLETEDVPFEPDSERESLYYADPRSPLSTPPPPVVQLDATHSRSPPQPRKRARSTKPKSKRESRASLGQLDARGLLTLGVSSKQETAEFPMVDAPCNLRKKNLISASPRADWLR